MIDIQFDDPETWEDQLKKHLGTLFTDREAVLQKPHRYVEDARRTLLDPVGRVPIIESTLQWIRENNLSCYHGTRLTKDDLASIRTRGLIPLSATDREDRLKRALSSHPRWIEIEPKLPSALDRGGKGVQIGNRSGQVHLTLSQAGLTNGFNHYLTHGSEFDQHIAYQLLGDDGMNLLAADGDAYVLHVKVPGDIAVQAAHRFFTPDDIVNQGDTPNLVSEFLEVLSYRVANPTFNPAELTVDCGLVLTSAIPSQWIAGCQRYTPSSA